MGRLKALRVGSQMGFRKSDVLKALERMVNTKRATASARRNCTRAASSY